MPSVSWLEVKTGNHFSQNPFVFANVSRKQAGEYICHARNPCGNDSKSGILTVICKYIYFLEYAKLEETLTKIKNLYYKLCGSTTFYEFYANLKAKHCWPIVIVGVGFDDDGSINFVRVFSFFC